MTTSFVASKIGEIENHLIERLSKGDCNVFTLHLTGLDVDIHPRDEKGKITYGVIFNLVSYPVSFNGKTPLITSRTSTAACIRSYETFKELRTALDEFLSLNADYFEGVSYE